LLNGTIDIKIEDNREKMKHLLHLFLFRKPGFLFVNIGTMNAYEGLTSVNAKAF